MPNFKVNPAIHEERHPGVPSRYNATRNCIPCASVRSTAWGRSHIAAGKCHRGCGRDLATKTMCRECAAAMTERLLGQRVARVAAGRCRTAGCGRALVTGTMCRECAAESVRQSLATQAAHVAEGKCRAGCGRDIAYAYSEVKCETHHWADTARTLERMFA